MLRAQGWATLAVAERDEGGATPVAVPTTYAVAGERLFLTMTDGRKRRALARNPRLCLTVADVRSLGAWRSVQVIGRARWLDDPADRAPAIDAFVAPERPDGFRLTDADRAHLAASLLLELEIVELHGYASGS